MSTTHPEYLHHHVVDADDNVIGEVTDVIHDDHNNTDTPSWLVVKPGRLQAERYVPIEGSYTAANGHVVVPYDKRWIKAAPKADRDHVVAPEVEHELEEHYGHA